MSGGLPANFPMVLDLRRITMASPSQWEGRLADGRSLYVRFRHDELSVHLGPVHRPVEDAVAAPALLTVDLSGAKWDGLLEFDHMLAATGLTLSPDLESSRNQL